MLKKALFLIILQILLIPGIVFSDEQESVRESTILFKLHADATPAELKELNALINPSTILESKEIEGLAIHLVKIRNIQGLEKAFSQQLMETGAVMFAEPDASIPHAVVPNDPHYSSQWHHTTINSPVAWDYITGPDDLDAVKVCVLDTGADTDHPDLVGNLLLPGYNARLELEGYVEDAHGHGTGTSGVIGAVGDNGIGVSGMAWDINIIPIQINISDSNSSAYISDMAVGIRWCADQGGKVANLSYGGAQYSTIDVAAQYLRDSGGLLFMSAGNDGTYNTINTYPDYSSFVVVGATSSSDVISYFSERGPFVDIAAPGQSILTTYPDGRYIYYSGTSFSSPMTAGLAALIFSVNPDFTPAEVENHIFNTAVDLGDPGDDDVYGHGRIDAGAAVISALDDLGPNDPPVALATANITNGDAPLTVFFYDDGSYDVDGNIVSYIWDFGDGSNTVSGTTSTHTYTEAGTFYVTLTVTDDGGAHGTSTAITITVTDPSIIEPPSNLTASVDANKVTLNWIDNSSNAVGFEIYRAKKIRGKYQFVRIVITDLTNVYVDEDLEISDYRYKVRAVGGSQLDVYSEYSNEVSVKVDTLPTDPDPGTLPTPVLSATSGGLIVTLTWTHDCPAEVTCTYHIERGVKVTGKITFAPLVSLEDTFSHQINEGSGTYYYKVYATAGSDTTSDDSNTVTVRLK